MTTLTRYRSQVLCLFVALPVAAAAGCGGAEETSQVEVPAPTRQEFIAQADAICRSAERDLNARSRELGFYTPDGLDEEEAEFVEEEVIPTFQRQFDEIGELTPPPGDEEEIEAVLSAAERDLDDLVKDPSRVPEGSQEFARQFRRYGSKSCAN